MKLESSPKAQKSFLRKQIRERRRNLNADDKQVMDRAIQRFVETYIAQSRANFVAAFWPFDGEPDLLPALKVLDREGVKLALPVIQHTAGSRTMIFRQWSSSTAMEDNRYGIPEPVRAPEALLDDIDLVLMPLVGWDESGGRLGMGAGFYDRALHPFRDAPSPLRVGIAYELQKVSRLPAEPWDVQLHMVLSENGWHTTPKDPT